MLISVSLWCMDLLFSHRIDKIMLYSDYLENDVITSCIPTVKCAEKKFVSAVIGMGIPWGASCITYTYTHRYTHTHKRGMGQRIYCEVGTYINTHYRYTLGYSNAFMMCVKKSCNYTTATPYQLHPIHPQVYPHHL